MSIIRQAAVLTQRGSTTPPSNLSYASDPVTYTEGVAITANNPTVTGTVASYSVSPALPAGLSLNESTGVITGTPTTEAVQASFVVTATNPYGNTTCSVEITIQFLPTSLSGLLMWHRSDQGLYTDDAATIPSVNTNTVAVWADLSGNGNHFTQTTGAKRPTHTTGVAAINNRAVLDGAGGDFMITAGNVTYGAYSVLMVGRWDTNSAYMYAHDGGSYTDYIYSNVGASIHHTRSTPAASGKNRGANWGNTAAYKTLTVLADGTHANFALRINGVDQSMTNHSSDTANVGNATLAGPVSIGAYGAAGSSPGTYKHAEILVYSRGLSVAEAQRLELYVRTRYVHY